ncbi:hypothetical protein GCM10007852_22840 [Agaribacter marinus]|uniref:Orphan protein n=2 Tax=Agaribacter marinus TaxID=1431249 RepID=A0AA37SX10_9ALTE|nr:hypothetical protein GCM10007852_22840 [Agaribacter marinus]
MQAQLKMNNKLMSSSFSIADLFSAIEKGQSKTKKIHTLLGYLLFSVLLTCNAVAEAHQVKAAISRVELNQRTNTLEIMHRFSLHDAEHAVQELFDTGADIHRKEETQKAFAGYVAERFGIYQADNTALDLTLVGYEIDGKHFWVYQETTKPEKLGGLQVVHNALRDIWHAQTNTVNVKFDDSINTLTFTDNTEVLNIDFSH